MQGGCPVKYESPVRNESAHVHTTFFHVSGYLFAV